MIDAEVVAQAEALRDEAQDVARRIVGQLDIAAVEDLVHQLVGVVAGQSVGATTMALAHLLAAMGTEAPNEQLWFAVFLDMHRNACRAREVTIQ